MPFLVRPAVVLALLLPAAGCVSYRYDVTTPATPDLQVVKDQDLIVPIAPARLRLRQVESRCVVLIENPTDRPLTLDGAESVIVDPFGQSRQVAGQLIAPGSFVKWVLPPLNDRPPAGPAFQFGIGAFVEGDTDRPAAYLDVGRATDYWEWSGEGSVRLLIAVKQDDKVVRHEVTVRRTKL